jgi:hypothetical protein
MSFINRLCVVLVVGALSTSLAGCPSKNCGSPSCDETGPLEGKSFAKAPRPSPDASTPDEVNAFVLKLPEDSKSSLQAAMATKQPLHAVVSGGSVKFIAEGTAAIPTTPDTEKEVTLTDHSVPEAATGVRVKASPEALKLMSEAARN